MHDVSSSAPWTNRAGPEASYAELAAALETLMEGEIDPIANVANATAAIFYSLPDLNWAGVYFLRGTELVVGPFQGRPACTRIPLGRGVCGTAAAERRSIRVADIAVFPGHIACDAASRSELVVPLISGRRLLGVLDLDSPRLARFGAVDQEGCETLAGVLARNLAALP